MRKSNLLEFHMLHYLSTHRNHGMYA